MNIKQRYLSSVLLHCFLQQAVSETCLFVFPVTAQVTTILALFCRFEEVQILVKVLEPLLYDFAFVTLLLIHVIKILPSISHLSPINLAGHLHSNELSPTFVQVPPL